MQTEEITHTILRSYACFYIHYEVVDGVGKSFTYGDYRITCNSPFEAAHKVRELVRDFYKSDLCPEVRLWEEGTGYRYRVMQDEHIETLVQDRGDAPDHVFPLN